MSWNVRFDPKKLLLKDVAALAAGCSFPFAFAPFQIAPLAYLSLAILFLGWKDAGPGRASLRGLLFGLGQFAVGVHWIYVCLHDYAGSTDLAAFIICASAVVFLAGFPALAGLLAALLAPNHAAGKWLLVYPGCWILSEWLRAWLEFPGFPWLQVGYSQVDAIPAALAPVLGVYGVGFFSAFSTGALLYSLQPACAGRKAVLISLGLVWSITALLQQHPWTSPAGRPLQVALLQGNIVQQLKWRPEVKRQALRWYIESSRNHWGRDLIVWPETAVPISDHRLTGLLEDLETEAVQYGSDLLIGLPVYDPEKRRSYNGIVTLGAERGRYAKRHLVPFGEYLPFQLVSGFVTRYMDFKMVGFSPGETRQPPIKAAGIPLAPSICYEDVFGQEMLAAMPDALYLVNITNDAWFGRSIALGQNLQMARMRSLETGRYLIRAANTGLTAIVSPFGDIIRMAPPFEATTLTGEIQPMQGITPYMLVGDYLILIGISFALLVVSL
ncbi:MAG: apolipoprotein N-acyltransferase [Methylococcaceae bacterium]|nr:apolipoprotein N-acyltransferase [Methylococcaceae bacterium]